jgi:type II secretory ATPase GspE/PulE/Tfp pilus assembly ATPase PilB-like protein
MSVSDGKLKRRKVKPQAGLKNTPITRSAAQTFDSILESALKTEASAIHIEPRPHFADIRFRIDGDLRPITTLPMTTLPVMASHLKMLATLKASESQLPQDGQFAFTAGHQTVTLHLSTLPTIDGERLVLRIVRQSSRFPSLTDLGVPNDSLKPIIRALRQPHGLVLVAGPAGSGKSTTLFSLLDLLNTPSITIATIEDPIQHQLVDATQTQCNPKAGLTFASGLRALLRQAPDIAMVGELRDSATANLAVQAALANCLVLSAVPAGTTATAMSHLRNLNIEPLLIASAAPTIIAQRLVRRLCSYCRSASTPGSSDLAILGQAFAGSDHLRRLHPGPFKLYTPGPGCAHCNGTGYQGRIGLYEVLEVDSALQQMIIHHAPPAAMQRQAVKAGMLTLQQDGLLKSLNGLTTVAEVMHAIRK